METLIFDRYYDIANQFHLMYPSFEYKLKKWFNGHSEIKPSLLHNLLATEFKQKLSTSASSLSLKAVGIEDLALCDKYSAKATDLLEICHRLQSKKYRDLIIDELQIICEV